MGKQDEQRDDPFASEVIQALTDLARLAQQASSVAVDAQERFTGLLLERLLALCAAQCGALSLTSRDKLPPVSEQEKLTATELLFQPKPFAAGVREPVMLGTLESMLTATRVVVAALPTASETLALML